MLTTYKSEANTKNTSKKYLSLKGQWIVSKDKEHKLGDFIVLKRTYILTITVSENNSYRFSRLTKMDKSNLCICDWKEVQTSSSKWVLNIIVKSCKKLKSLICLIFMKEDPSHMPRWKNSICWMVIPTLRMGIRNHEAIWKMCSSHCIPYLFHGLGFKIENI